MMRPVHLILLIGMNLVWAATAPIYKALAEHLSSGPIATLRFGLAALCLLALWPWLPGRGPRGRDFVKTVIMGAIVFCVAPRLQIEGVHRGQAGDTSLLIALDPLIVGLAAAVFLGERIPPRRWWGFGLGMLGVVLLSRVWAPDARLLTGLVANGMFVGSFFCEATYSVLGKPMLQRCGALKLLGAGLFGGAFFNALWEGTAGDPGTLAAVQQLPVTAWLLLGYMAVVCTVLGYALWYAVIRESDVNLAGLTVFVQPVAGLALSVVWLGESLHWGQLWGSLVIVTGLAVGLRPDQVWQTGSRLLTRTLRRMHPALAPLPAERKEVAEENAAR